MGRSKLDAILGFNGSTTQSRHNKPPPNTIHLPLGIYSLPMASTRFQSGVDDRSVPPGRNPPQDGVPFATRERVYHERNQFGNRLATGANVDVASSVGSYIDDRMPTARNGPLRNGPAGVQVGSEFKVPSRKENNRPWKTPFDAPGLPDGASRFFSAIDPGTTLPGGPAPGPAPVLGVPRYIPPDADDRSSRFMSAIDGGAILPAGPAPESPWNFTRDVSPDTADGATRFQSGINTSGPPRIDAGAVKIDRSLAEVSRADRVKPLDGDLLRKLFKHTLHEQQKEDNLNRRNEYVNSNPNPPAPCNSSESKRGPVIKPDGFYIPDREDLREARSKNKKEVAQQAAANQEDQVKAEQPPAVAPRPPRSNAANGSLPQKILTVRIKGKNGDNALVNLPVLTPVPETSESSSYAPAAQSHAKPNDQETRVETEKKQKKKQQPQQQHKQGQNKGNQQTPQPKKGKGKNKKQGNQEQDRQQQTREAAEALMSGALPVEEAPAMKSPVPSAKQSFKDSTVGFEGMFELGTRSSHSSAKSERAKMQPTVESVASQTPSSKQSQASRAKSAGTGLEKEYVTAASEADGSVRSFEEIGQGWTEHVASKPASRQATPKSLSKPAPALDAHPERMSAGEWREIGEVTSPNSIPKAPSRTQSAASWQQIGQGSFKAEPPPNMSRNLTPNSLNGRKPSVQSIASAGRECKRAPSIQSFKQEKRDWDNPPSHRSGSARRSETQKGRRAPSRHDFQVDEDGWNEDLARNSHSEHSSRREPTPTRSAGAYHQDGSDGGNWGQSQNSPRASNQSSAREPSRAPTSSDSSSADDGLGGGMGQRLPSRHSEASRQSGSHSTNAFRPPWAGWPERTSSERSGLSPPRKFPSRHSSRDPGPSRQGIYSVQDKVNFNEPSIHASAGWPREEPQVHAWPGYEEPQRSSRYASPEQSLRKSPVVSTRRNQVRSRLSHQSRRSGIDSHHSRTQRSQYCDAFLPDEVDEEGQQCEANARNSSHSMGWQQDCRDSQPKLDDERPETRDTIFAGKGWISPHPLSEAPSEFASPPQSKIVLPSNAAYPRGATMSYEEWKDVQERGIEASHRRNFSITESSKTRNGVFDDDRYRFDGWEGRSFQGVNPVEVGSEISSRSGRQGSHHSRSTRSERSAAYTGSGWGSGPSSGYAETIEDSQLGSRSGSIRRQEDMEEGHGGW